MCKHINSLHPAVKVSRQWRDTINKGSALPPRRASSHRAAPFDGIKIY